MKKLSLFFCFLSNHIFSQEVLTNYETKKFEYVQIIQSSDTLIKSNVLKYFSKLNYNDIKVSDNFISGSSFFADSVMGFPVKYYYTVSFEFKTGKYKVCLSNFIIEDHTKLPIPLEDVPYMKGMWVRKANKKIPIIVQALISKEKDW